jgi:hypothetical protein
MQPITQSFIELDGLGYLRLLGMKLHQCTAGRFAQRVERQ